MDESEGASMEGEEGTSMDAKTERNLIDAGCSKPLIGEFAALASKDERLRWLARYRRSLIGSIHEEQKKLDCLDYLIYSLRNNG